jgi:large subunit ribosomal protein L20
MPRVKRAMGHVKKRKTLRKLAKGFKWGRKNTIRLAKTAVKKAGKHAYADRKRKKRVNRALWLVKLNAAVRGYDLSYSKFIAGLKAKKIELDRKVLAEIAEKNPEIFAKIVAPIK